jgi:hypothetical protein
MSVRIAPLLKTGFDITGVSEEHSASIIRGKIIGELGTLAVISNGRTLRRNTGATRRNISEDGILHSHRRGNLKTYIDFDKI